MCMSNGLVACHGLSAKVEEDMSCSTGSVGLVQLRSIRWWARDEYLSVTRRTRGAEEDQCLSIWRVTDRRRLCKLPINIC